MAQVIELKINGALQPKMVLDTQLSEELKWAQLDLDLHLKASLLTGLISNDDIWFIPYLYEDSPGQAVEIVVFLDVFHRVEKLRECPGLSTGKKRAIGNGSHYVKEVIYGAN